MSGAFRMLEGEAAVLYEGGVYREVLLAVRGNGELFAKAKGGFVRLYADGGTSYGSRCKIDTIFTEQPLYRDRLGKLCVSSGKDRKPVENPFYLPSDTYERIDP